MPTFNEQCIFLLGAGASARAGIPISVELNKQILTRLRQEYSNPNSPQRQLVNFLIGTIYYYRGLNNIEPIESQVNIEQVLTTLRILKDREKELVSAFVGNWHDKLRFFSNDLLEEFDRYLFRLIVDKLNIRDSVKTDYLKWFIEIHKKYSSAVNIFTLNQDLSLETAFQRNLQPFSTGFDNKGIWNPDVFDGEGSGEQNAINIHKLHGSLGWQKDKDTGQINSTRSFGISDEHLMIFGVLEKLTIEEPYFELIKRFKAKAKQANLIVVIGYSFSDLYINNILFESLRVTTNKRVLIVDMRATSILDELKKKYEKSVSWSLFEPFKEDCKVEDAFSNKDLEKKIENILKELSDSPF